MNSNIHNVCDKRRDGRQAPSEFLLPTRTKAASNHGMHPLHGPPTVRFVVCYLRPRRRRTVLHKTCARCSPFVALAVFLRRLIERRVRTDTCEIMHRGPGLDCFIFTLSYRRRTFFVDRRSSGLVLTSK